MRGPDYFRLILTHRFPSPTAGLLPRLRLLAPHHDTESLRKAKRAAQNAPVKVAFIFLAMRGL